jgi:hypothetical protein
MIIHRILSREDAVLVLTSRVHQLDLIIGIVNSRVLRERSLNLYYKRK